MAFRPSRSSRSATPAASRSWIWRPIGQAIWSAAGWSIRPRRPAWAAALAKAEQEDLLPRALMTLSDGIPNAAFVREFGDTKDPRFLAAMARIDAALRRSAARRNGPLAALPAS